MAKTTAIRSLGLRARSGLQIKPMLRRQRTAIAINVAARHGTLTDMAIEIDPETGEEIVGLDDEAENWMQQHRLEQLRARGWTGTVLEYVETWDRIDADPLEQTPPITGPESRG